MENFIETSYQHHYTAITSNTRTLGRNLIGAFLILVISLLTIVIILTPEMVRLFNRAIPSKGAWDWIAALGSILIVGFLIVFPVTLIIQGFVYYRDARDLERIGVLTKGSIAEKWVDTSDGKPIYHILFKYSLGLNSMQIVDESVFQSLQRDQSVDVLHLQHAPHISRLELSS